MRNANCIGIVVQFQRSTPPNFNSNAITGYRPGHVQTAHDCREGKGGIERRREAYEGRRRRSRRERCDI
jgi:hypothetical protein